MREQEYSKKRLREYDEACDIRKNLNDRNLSRDHVPTLYGLCREIILKENDKLCEETFIEHMRNVITLPTPVEQNGGYINVRW